VGNPVEAIQAGPETVSYSDPVERIPVFSEEHDRLGEAIG